MRVDSCERKKKYEQSFNVAHVHTLAHEARLSVIKLQYIVCVVRFCPAILRCA